ncbi:hypothetical protein CYLTODRAFT_361836 [Cylindrobasidium torrendii FP15055 ss-10]|uniref:Uncharacterized protein n=1 Tax=Cylindrobasidium torrendii FP15055 ss-10 TaxID=1314674 RepID=A0A0D7AVI7_9AGAR|nr:hypothetical protein CYLTODRAFT_361836 [Cylindrobasidium torrendii FP15055 ss-10]
MSSNRALRKEQRRVSIYTQLHPLRSSGSSDASEDDSSDDRHLVGDIDVEEAAQPTDLDESWPYTFRAGDRVWVRIAEDDWRSGEIFGNKTKSGPTREKEGTFYPVVLTTNRVRKWFAPLNGDIKPDSTHIRRLLDDAGLLNQA